MAREPHGGRERGLHAPRLRSAQALDAQPAGAAELDLALERLGLVAVARDDERPVRAQAGVGPGGAQVLRERGPARGAGEPERRQPLLAERRLGDRREHAGGDVRRARADRVALVDDDAPAALRGAPGDAQPDRPRADDGEIETRL